MPIVLSDFMSDFVLRVLQLSVSVKVGTSEYIYNAGSLYKYLYILFNHQGLDSTIYKSGRLRFFLKKKLESHLLRTSTANQDTAWFSERNIKRLESEH